MKVVVSLAVGFVLGCVLCVKNPSFANKIGVKAINTTNTVLSNTGTALTKAGNGVQSITK